MRAASSSLKSKQYYHYYALHKVETLKPATSSTVYSTVAPPHQALGSTACEQGYLRSILLLLASGGPRGWQPA